jgi:hypothetical protein
LKDDLFKNVICDINFVPKLSRTNIFHGRI